MCIQREPMFLLWADVSRELMDSLALRGEVHQGTISEPVPPEAKRAAVVILRSPFRALELQLSQLPRLRWIIRAGTGLDNIDIVLAKQRGITIRTTPFASDSVAELAVGLLVACARELPRWIESMRRGRWDKAIACGMGLAERRALIVGYGRVGQRVARALNGLGMRILICDPGMDSQEKRDRLRGLEDPVVCTLYEGLSMAHAVVLCCPLNDTTRNMIDSKALAIMTPGAILINVSRGAVVDDDALLHALDAGQLRAAGLDVHSREPPGQTPLLSHARVISTPHLGAQTMDAQGRLAAEVLRIVDAEILPAWCRLS